MPNTEQDQYSEHFDAGHSGKDHSVHQRLRANSAIMEMKKILGAKFPTRHNWYWRRWAACEISLLTSGSWPIQWPIEARYVKFPFAPETR